MQNQGGNFLSNQSPYQMGNLKKINEKRKLIDDLTLFLNSNKTLINDPVNKDKFSELYQVLLTLLNENNNSFISAEINLLKLMSDNIKNNQQFGQFLIASLPKLFDKFYLQNPKINQELISLFNIFVKNGLKVEYFFPNIENMSMEEDDNYRVPLLDFLYSQIQNNSNLNINSVPKPISNLLKKLSEDSNTEVSNIAFNSFETLNIRMSEMENKERTQKKSFTEKNSKEIKFSSLINAIAQTVKSEINEDNNNNNNVKNIENNNNVFNNKINQSPNPNNTIGNTVFNNNMNQISIPNINSNVYYNNQPQLQNNNMINNMLLQNQMLNNNLNYNQITQLQNQNLNNNLYNNQISQLQTANLNNIIQMGQLQNPNFNLQNQFLNNNLQINQLQNPNLNNNLNLQLQNPNLNNPIFNNQINQLQTQSLNNNLNSNLNSNLISQLQNPNLNTQILNENKFNNDLNQINNNNFDMINRRNFEDLNQNKNEISNYQEINQNNKIKEEIKKDDFKKEESENNIIENKNKFESPKKEINEKTEEKNIIETKEEIVKKEDKEIEEKKEIINQKIEEPKEEEENKLTKKKSEKHEEPKEEEENNLMKKNSEVSEEKKEEENQKKKSKPALKRVNKFRKMFGKQNNQNKDFVLVEKPMKNEDELNKINDNNDKKEINELKENIENNEEKKEQPKKIEVNIKNKFKTINNEINENKEIQEEKINKEENEIENKIIDNNNKIENNNDIENNNIENNNNTEIKKEEKNDEIPKIPSKKRSKNIKEKQIKSNNDNNENIENIENKKSIDIDDRPIKPTKNNFVNRPIKQLDIDVDERPIKPASSNFNENNFNNNNLNNDNNNNNVNYDDIPIKGIINNNKEEINTPPPEKNEEMNENQINDNYDERPIKSTNYDFDEMPIKNNFNLDIINNNFNNIDEKPIQTKSIENEILNSNNKINNIIDERPIKPMDGYDKNSDVTLNENNNIQSNNNENNNNNEPEEENFIVDKNTKKKENPFPKKKILNRFKKDKKIEVQKKEKEESINNSNNMNNDRTTIPISLNSEDITLTTEKEEKMINKKEDKSINEFEKKLQLALEQEKDGLLTQKDNNQKSNVQNKKEDPKYDEIKNILGNDIINNLNSTKWEEKKNGFELINKFIENTDPSNYNINDLIQYIKFKLKDFKETNFNIIREAFNIFNNLITKKIIDKENSIMILNAYYEKLGDLKIKDNMNQMLLNLKDFIGPEEIMLNLIPKLIKKPNVKLLNEYSLFFGKIIDEYDINGLPIKDCVDLCKTMANNTNPQVRSSATNLLCIIYKYVGNELRKMIKDIKESTLKIIESELDKVTVIDKKSPDLKKKKKVGSSNEKKLTLIPIVDISKKITNQMLKDIKSGKWPEKKLACENIEKILENANMKILPNGLNDLFNLIKEKLSDGNKNIVRMIISLLTKLIESLGNGFKQYTKNIALALIPNLADKMQMLREDCQNCLDKWVEFTGFDTIIYYFPSFLKTDNVDIRTEILSFIKKYKDKFNKVIGETLFKDMINPLLLVLQDRSSSVRILAEDILKFSLNYINLSNYQRKLKDFKPAIQNDLKQILDRIQNESNITEDDSQINVNNNINNILNTNNSNNKDNNSLEKNDSVKLIEKSPVKDEKNQRQSPIKKRRGHQLSNDDVINSVNNKSTILSKEKNTNENKLETNSTVLKNTMKISNSRDKKKITKFNYTNQSQIFINNIKVTPNKNKRLEQDKKYKFSLETVSRDYSQKLKEQVRSLFTEDYIKKIFSEDFKQQSEAMKILKGSIDKNENVNIILDNLDLILKTIGLKMNNQNPSLLKSLFEFLETLLFAITNNNYTLSDIESNIIISMLIDKLSITNNNLRKDLLSLINKYIEIIGAKSIIIYLINCGLGKNTRIKSDVLELVTNLHLEQQIDICQRTIVRLLSKFLSVNDYNIKTKIIILFKEIYNKIHDELWNFIDVNEKEREFLEDNLFNDEEEVEEEEEEIELQNEEESEENEDNNSSRENSNYNDEHKIIVQQKNNNDNQQINNINGQIKDKNELIITMNNLLTDDPTERVNAIIIIHDLICAKYEDNKIILIENIDTIIRIFITAMKNLFNTNDITTIPIKFSKYLATVLCKIASNKELISHISYDVLYELSEELLSNLLIENLDKIGNNQEGSIIFKSLNSTMLRILENCNSTNVILALLDLIKSYRTKGEKSKVAGLAIKCLLKVNQNLASIINSISVDKILLQIHILLIDFEQTQPDLTPKTQTDQMVIRFIRNLINDLVKLKSSKILLDYNLVKNHGVNDKYILKWIKNTLNIIQTERENNLNIMKQYSTSNNNPQKNINQNNSSNSSRQFSSSNQNTHSNNQINTHDFNNTMSQLKKKWNDINRNNTNMNKK